MQFCVPPLLVLDRTYDFRVLVLKGDRSDSAFTRVRVAASNLPVTASLQSPTEPVYKVDPNGRLVVRGRVESMEPVETAWNVFRKFSNGAEDEEINGTAFEEQRSINEVSLVVSPGRLPLTSTSVEYTFRLTASGAGGTSSAEMTVLVNSAPSGGLLRVEPEEGYAFGSFVLASTESSWTDDAEDFPLSCRFGYMDPRGRNALRYLTDRALSFVSPLVVLPVGEPPLFNYSTFVETTDVWGSSGLATARVQVAQGNATMDDAVAALVRTEGIGGGYAAYHIVDALAVQKPDESVVDQLSDALHSKILAEAITAGSSARVVNTLSLVARNGLSSGSLDDCIAVVEHLAACTRRDGSDLQPCRFSRADMASLAGAVSDLLNAARGVHVAPDEAVRRLTEAPSSPAITVATSRVQSLLDMVQVLVGATLAPLVSGESAELSAGAFAMELGRRQEIDYLAQDILSGSHRVLSIPTGLALPGAASRTIGAVLTVWAGQELPFFWDTTSAQPACMSKLTDVEVGNTTRWSRRGIYKTVGRAVPLLLVRTQCQHVHPLMLWSLKLWSLWVVVVVVGGCCCCCLVVVLNLLMAQCAGLPTLSSSVVSFEFLSESGARTIVTADHNNSAPYIVRVPTEAQYGCGSRLNESGPLINCTRFDGSRWILDGIPVGRNLTHTACAFSTAAALSSTGFAAFCAPAPRYDQLDLTTSVAEPTVQLTGLYVCCGLLPALIAAHALELSALREKKRTAKASRKTEFRERVGKYGYRDTTFAQRIRINSRASSHTLIALVHHLKGNPHTQSEGVILITITLLVSMAVCSLVFEAPVASLLCERICTCREDELTGPHCQYDCHTECRSFDCGSEQMDLQCATAASHATCDLEASCKDFDPTERVLQAIAMAVGVLSPLMIFPRWSFSWLRTPAKSYILGVKRTPACARCRPKPPADLDQDAAQKYEVTDEVEDEPENEIAEAMIAKLHNKFTPVHVEVTQVNDLGTMPAKFKIVLASALFKKLPADKQRRALVTATLADELAKQAKIDVLESWTPAQWREIERQAEAEAKWKARQKARGQMKLTALLGRAPVEFSPREFWPSTCPYILSCGLMVASVTVVFVNSRHFADGTAPYWLLASTAAALIKLTVVDLALLLFEPKGPVQYFIVKRAWPWLRDQVQAWRGQRRVHVNNDDELIPELSTSEDEVEDDTAVGLAWEFYHGKRHKPKPPVVEAPKRPPTPEIRAWAREMHDAVEDRTAISFRKEAVLEAVALPNALDREYVPEAVKKQRQWDGVMAGHELAAIEAAHTKLRDRQDHEAAAQRAAASEMQRQKTLAEAARRRRGRLELTAARTGEVFAAEQESEAIALRAADQARKYQDALDEAARRRERRAELASARAGAAEEQQLVVAE